MIRSSTPPGVPPKFTVTAECGDVHVTMRVDSLTPAEASDLCVELQLASAIASQWRWDEAQPLIEACKVASRG